MKSKLKLLIIAGLLSISLSACVGPPKDDRCIPSDGNTTQGQSGGGAQTNSPGTGQSGSIAQKIDSALKEGKIISTVVRDIKTALIGTGGSFTGAQGIFQGFVNSPAYQSAIGAAFSLFVIIYGMSVAVGMVQVSLGDAAVRVAKIGFISVVAMNWNIFYYHIGSFFIEGTDELISYFMTNFESLYQTPGGSGSGAGAGGSGSGGPQGQIFSGYDDLIARIFSFQTFAFISALFNSGPYAPIYGFLLILTMWWLLQSIMKVVQVYIFSLFAKALLFALAPVFLAFLLFERTKPMFDAWLNQLISFSLQPILITAYIGLFSQLITPFFEEFANYKMCWNRLDNTTDKWGWRFVNKSSASADAVEFGQSSTPPIHFQAVLLFMFFAWLFKTALNMTDNIVVSITQTAAGNLSNIQGLSMIREGIGSGTSGVYGRSAGDAMQNLGANATNMVNRTR